MARTTNGRRRGKKTGTEGKPVPAPAAPATDPALRPSPPRREEPRTEWVSREEPLVFPTDAAAAAKAARIALPSSGLAEDILAMADAAQVAAESTADVPAPAAMTPAVASSVSTAGDAALRAHNISFFASPVREERKAVEPTEHLATFYLAGEEYGVDVRMVQEIIRVSEITPVPRAPEFIKGVINLRGRIIPVVDLKRKLNLGEVEAARQARIVVVKLRDRLIGLLVDGASQVLKIPLSAIEAAPEEVVEIDANYIRGVAKMADRLIILVDLNKILSLELREGPGAL